MNGKSPGTLARFIGIDLHKHYLVVGGVNAGQEVVLPPRRVKMQAMIRNRLHSMVHRHNLTLPKGEAFSREHRGWWLGLEISRTENLRIRQDLATMDHLEPQIAEIDTELNRLSTCAPWADQVPYLLQLPGFGLTTTMTLLAAIG